MFPEQSIIGARASVMIYDEGLKKWIPSGNSSGLSKVQIFHHIQNNTFRVVGRKLQDHEVVINCSIVKGLKYNQATATFHQWRDSKFVYGLNFSSQQDAENFARAMMHTLEVLSGRAVSVPGGNAQNNHQQPQNIQQQQQHPQQNSYDEDMGYRTMTREDADMLNQQPLQQQIMSPQTPTSQTMGVQQQQQGHHRASSAPQAPQMPPTMSVLPQQQQAQMQNYPPQSQQQQFPIYASGTSQQMNHQQQQQNGVPIYVPSSISIQNSLNSVATAPKPAPVPPPLQNNTYGHGMMQQQQQQQSTPQQQIPQYMPSLQQQVSIPGAPVPPPAPPAGFGNSIPPCPPPVPNSAGIPPCPPPVPTNASSSAPPPPPPLPNGGAKSGGMDMGSLAAQLQQAKLRKTSTPQNQSSANENSGNSTSSSSSGNYGTIGRTGGGGGGEMASMMDEMAKTLARRRERQKDTNTQDGDNDKWEKSNTLPHKLSSSNSQTLPSSSSSNAASSLADSPQSRKRFGSASEETILKQVNGGDFSLPPAFDMKAFKAEILKEMRSEITKAKNEIIDAIKVELNRRR